MAVAQLDLDRIGVDDRLCGDVLARARERGGRVVVDGGAREVFAPAAGFILEHDDPVDEPVGGDNLGQTKVPFARGGFPGKSADGASVAPYSTPRR